MSPSVKFPFAFALMLTACSVSYALAASGAPVEYLGARLGYTVIDDHASGTVTLKRPGAVVILRPGTQIYTVNGRTEVARTAPQSRGGLLYVGPRLASELRHIAAVTAQASRLPLPRLEPINAVGALKLALAPVAGQTEIAITGTGPAGALVSITLLGEISADLPTVVLSRHSVTVGQDGKFVLTSSTAPLYTLGTRVVVKASAGIGVTPATASIVLGKPNPNVVSPVDMLSPGQPDEPHNHLVHPRRYHARHS